MYTVHNVHTEVRTCSEESTLGSSKDPVNVDCPGWKSSQVVQGSGVFDIEGVKSLETCSSTVYTIHNVHTKVSQASQQHNSASKSVRNVTASGSRIESVRNVSPDECAREECDRDVLLEMSVQNDGIQASQSKQERCAKSSSFNTLRTGGNMKNEKGDMKEASKVESFDNQKILNGGRGVTEIISSQKISLSLTSNPKHSDNSDRVCTPVKRKLIQQKNVSRLISNFESTSASDTHWGEVTGSPAKRRKHIV